jgi:hypothetical protein
MLNLGRHRGASPLALDGQFRGAGPRIYAAMPAVIADATVAAGDAVVIHVVNIRDVDVRH